MIAPKEAEKLPVMFWIHESIYNFKICRKRRNTSDNELSPFGGLLIQALSAEWRYMALDMIAALKWVKNNI